MGRMTSNAAKLRTLLAEPRCHMVPCCWDPLSAKLIEQSGAPFSFMSGFAVAASRLGEPDLGLISYAEIVDTVRNISAVTTLPLIADGDTGYGNALNVERTVRGWPLNGAVTP
jgi:2-methylisocitrate lyase-like PEP mutase family enzyme